jgi:hypothetical protein
MNAQLVCDGTPGLNYSFYLQAQDASTPPNAEPATGTGTIDNYSAAFLANVGTDAFQIIPKITLAPGAPTQTVNATFALTDTASGVALPPLVVSVDLVAPPHPTQKAVVVVVTSAAVGTGSSATDPGSAQIPVSLT